MARLERVRVHPIKALDRVERDRVRISEVGGLTGDRAYAIRDADGGYVNGKRTAAVHRLQSDVDLESGSVTLGERGGGQPRHFDLDGNREALADWLSTYFGLDVTVEAAPGGELTDTSVLGDAGPGATLVSTATVETVASWFPDVDAEGVRRRFRTNLEVSGVEPFWEDGLVGPDGTSGSRVQVGDVEFRAVEPVPRCVVPTRDPDTGEPTEGFRERFIERRTETFPARADGAAFDHLYALTVLVRPARGHRGRSIRVGDDVEVEDGARE